jgi:hypothetical protein
MQAPFLVFGLRISSDERSLARVGGGTGLYAQY